MKASLVNALKKQGFNVSLTRVENYRAVKTEDQVTEALVKEIYSMNRSCLYSTCDFLKHAETVTQVTVKNYPFLKDLEAQYNEIDYNRSMI